MTFSHENDEHWMQQALQQAQHALAVGEVPVGAVLVQNGMCVAVGHNNAIHTSDPTAHAEIVALKQAAEKTQNYRLMDSTLYVTLEPCAMCAMAALHARVDRVVYGASDPKTGAAGSLLNLFDMPELNHHTTVTGGVLAKECSQLLKDFFIEKRKQKPTLLREDALRTSENSFDHLSSLPKEQVLDAAHSHYTSDLPALKQLQLHYYFYSALGIPQTQENPLPHAKGLCLLLHDADAFSDQYAGAVSPLQKQGYALLIPDLIGFGRSDKPKKSNWHSIEAHTAYLFELIVHTLKGDKFKQTNVLEADNHKLSIVAPAVFSGLLTQLEQKLFGEEVNVQLELSLVETLPALSVQHALSPYPNAGFNSGKEAFKQQLEKQASPLALNTAAYPSLCVYLKRADKT